MITLIYHVRLGEKEDELRWLREQSIFPAVENHWDWVKEEAVAKFGVIVNQEAALAIKLRHKIDLQNDYRQR